MKKIILLILCLSANAIFSQNAGLAGELVYIKQTSEAKAIDVINSPQITDDSKADFIKLYNEVKAQMARLTMQMIADCARNNDLRSFKRIDDLLLNTNIAALGNTNLGTPKLNSYVAMLKKIHDAHEALMNFKPTPKSREELATRGFLSGLGTIEGALDVFGTIQGILKDFRESREKKIDKITTMLKEFQLVPLQDLEKTKAKKDEK